jgi:GntR family transcriptional regulator/MocR family aminotransferase
VRRGPTPGPATLDQLTLARFVADGAFARHLRAARGRYARRRAALLAALDRELPGARVGGIAAGMHVTVDLAGLDLPGLDLPGLDLPGVGPARPDAAAVVREGAARDVALVDLRRYQAAPSARSTVLVVGYGNLADARLAEAVRSLRAAVEAAVG